MAYTDRDNIKAKSEIMYILAKQGYAPYARLIKKFYISLTDDPETTAAIIPEERIIILNPENLNRSMKAASIAVRTEILRVYLDHALRAVRHLGQEKFDSRSDAIKDRLFRASSYEISDIGYTEADMQVIRSLNQLLLADDYPEWHGLTYEEIYDKLSEIESEAEGDGESGQDGQQGQQGQGQSGEGQSGQGDQGQNGSGQGDGDPQPQEEKSAEYKAGWREAISQWHDNRLKGDQHD